jgi:uncharacterized protein HemX
MNEDTNVQKPDFEGEEMKMPENTATQQAASESTNDIINGPLLVVLAVLLVAILGGMYYWFSTMTTPAPEPVIERPTPEQNNEPESTTAEAQTDIMLTTSPSDEITAIEADIEATDFDNLDAELQAIDAELEAALQ